MAERPNAKPVLQKPPGYRDPAAPAAPAANKPPPRKAALPPTFRQTGKAPPRRRRRSICHRLCCCLLLLFFVLAFLLAVAGALSYLWFQPKLPSFHLQSLQAPSFNITVRSDGTFLDSVTGIRVQASNPNGKIRLSYGESQARVSVADDDGDVAMGSSSFPGFVQGKKNSTVLRFSASVKGQMVDDAVGSRLKSRFRSKELRFSVEVRTRLGVRFGGKATGEMPIRVLCEDVSLKQMGRGATSPKCTINLLRWINLH